MMTYNTYNGPVYTLTIMEYLFALTHNQSIIEHSVLSIPKYELLRFDNNIQSTTTITTNTVNLENISNLEEKAKQLINKQLFEIKTLAFDNKRSLPYLIESGIAYLNNHTCPPNYYCLIAINDRFLLAPLNSDSIKIFRNSYLNFTLCILRPDHFIFIDKNCWDGDYA